MGTIMQPRSNRRTLFTRAAAGLLATTIAIVPVAAAIAPEAVAEEGLLLSNGKPQDSASLATGEQLLLTTASTTLPFAGQEVNLSDFTGLVGYSNDLAYVVVLDGAAQSGSSRAEPGWMLIFRPFGGETSVERFDAIRLAGKWSEAVRTASPSAWSSLERIRADQELGVWFGRLGQTRFNVAASGSARNEKATRALMGDPTVRDIRFSGASEPAAVEQNVASRFFEGLRTGDVKAVSALLDPTPFGGRTLGGGADAARLQAASVIVASRDWNELTAGATPQFVNGVWRAGKASVQLRAVDDFVFVSRVAEGQDD